MKKSKKILAASVMLCVVMVAMAGCAQKPQSEGSSEAIQQAMQLKTVEEQANYLVKEANAFLNSQKFDDAVNTAKYVLSSLDANSDKAKTILEKAQVELKKVAEAKVAELQKSFGSLGK